MATKTATKTASTEKSSKGLDGIGDNADLGTQSKEDVYPEGAFVAGIPDWLPLYRDESVTETISRGDVTWYHTDKGRWLTTKGVVAQATTVTHGPDEDYPEPEKIRERNDKLAARRAKQIAEEQNLLIGRAMVDSNEVRAELRALGQSKQLGHAVEKEGGDE